MNNMLFQTSRKKPAKQKFVSYGPEGGPLSGELSQQIQSRRGGGQPLNSEMLQSYSEKFRRNMADVRVHHDEESAKLNAQLHSGAFTVGSDIFLGKDVAPDDKAVMSHELTHVAQNDGKAPSGSLTLGAANTAQEREASAGQARSSAPAGTVQRGFFGAIGRFFKRLFGKKKAPRPAAPVEPITDGWEVVNYNKKIARFNENIEGNSQEDLFDAGERDEAAKYMPGSAGALIDDGAGLIEEDPSGKDISQLDDSFSLADEENSGSNAIDPEQISEFDDEEKFEPMDMHSGFNGYEVTSEEKSPEDFAEYLRGRGGIRIHSALRDVVPDAVEKAKKARIAAEANMGDEEIEALSEALLPLTNIQSEIYFGKMDRMDALDDPEEEQDYYGGLLGDELKKGMNLIKRYKFTHVNFFDKIAGVKK